MIAGDLVLQQRTFQDQHSCVNHRHVGHVHSQQLHFVQTTSNFNNQIHWYLDYLWLISSLCHHNPSGANRAPTRKKQPCLCWKFKNCWNAEARFNCTRCNKDIRTKSFTNFWNCVFHLILNVCFHHKQLDLTNGI